MLEVKEPVKGSKALSPALHSYQVILSSYLIISDDNMVALSSAAVLAPSSLDFPVSVSGEEQWSSQRALHPGLQQRWPHSGKCSQCPQTSLRQATQP